MDGQRRYTGGPDEILRASNNYFHLPGASNDIYHKDRSKTTPMNSKEVRHHSHVPPVDISAQWSTEKLGQFCVTSPATIQFTTVVEAILQDNIECRVS